MAGRGTDIKLTPSAREAGGLAIIGTERHESRRIDRQLRGRAGRQGDVGSSQFFISLEDNLMRLFVTGRIAKIMDRLGLQTGEMIQHRMVTNSIERAQKRVEQNNYAVRKRLLEYDNEINKQREVVYSRRKDALFASKLRFDIMNIFYNVAEQLTSYVGQLDNYVSLKTDLLRVFGIHTQITPELFESKQGDDRINLVYQELFTAYQAKNQLLQHNTQHMLAQMDEKYKQEDDAIIMLFTDGQQRLEVVIQLEEMIRNPGETLTIGLARTAIITFIDQYWQEHLRNMDELRQSVQNAVYEQKDPLLVYKFEAYALFKNFIHQVNQAIAGYITKSALQAYSTKGAVLSLQHKHPVRQESKQDMLSLLHTNYSDSNHTKPPKNQSLKTQKIARRNQRVTVRYKDGTVLENVKFKSVEEDIANQHCVLIDAK